MKSGTGNHELMYKIKANLKSYLLSKLAYFSEDKVLPLTGSGLEQIVAVIVKKSHFFETEKIYPISNKLHVVKALNLESSSLCPFEDAGFFYDLEKNEQGYKAHFWFYKKSLLMKINGLLSKKAIFLFPENFLIAKALPVEKIAFIEDGNYWVSNVSKQKSFKIVKNNSVLLKDKKNSILINTLAHKFTLFTQGLYKALPVLLNFKLTSAKAKDGSCRYCQFLQNAFIATFLYLVSSSVLIKGIDVFYQSKIQTNKELIADFLKVRASFQAEQKTYKELTVGFEGNVSPSSIFNLLALTTSSYTLERISTRDNTVFITAISEEPLDVLEDMINLDHIENVHFANKVSDINIDNFKRFTITYQH
ncbi:hypothetical protein A9Q74_10495 [Colwellia sp. 39_35_sub15_T18]|nr:hypothetical protein A9Q74_10495 [Colwellia sp. 39_35_sub15_T18]